MREMDDEEILRIANEIAGEHGFTAEFLGDIRRVGVQGDARTYTRVIVLKGEFPGWDRVSEVSTAISNRTPVAGVTLETTHWKVEEP